MAATPTSTFVSSSVSASFSALNDGAESFCWSGGETPSIHSGILYGRTEETVQLLTTYYSLMNSQTSQTVMVHGESGSGKTSLVDQLRTAAVDSGGYFVSGKFFQKQAGPNEPYAPIMAAFSDLCDLVSQSDDFLARQPVIQQRLGDAGSILSKNITHLSPFIDPSYIGRSKENLETDASLVQFAVACKTFLNAMTCKEHPIIFVLDDLQWMDKESQHLISFLLRQSELGSIMFVVMYRDEEESQDLTSNFIKAIDNPFVDLSLGNLKADAIQELVSSMLSLSPRQTATRDLCDLIAKRTLGNPFHILCFVDLLKRDGLLQTASDNAGGGWLFDVEEITKQTKVADTVAEVLQKRIQLLPPDVQNTVKIASFLGFRFSKKLIGGVVLAMYGEDGDHEMLENGDGASFMVAQRESTGCSLDVAEKEGLIEKTSEGYQFCHDKFQSTLQSLSTPNEIASINKNIGTILLTYEGEMYKYHAAIHLNRTSELSWNREKRLKHARLNLEATKYCQTRHYFFEATTLLARGLQLIPEEESAQWANQYDLKLQMTNMLAKVALTIGNFDLCRQMYLKVVDRARCLDDKLDAMFTQIYALSSQSKFQECIVAADESLKTLGFAAPTSFSVPAIMYKFQRVKRLLRGKSDADILNLPLMTEKAMSLTVNILVVKGISCMLDKQPKRGALCALQTLEYSLKNGLSPFTAGAFAVFGAMQMALCKFEAAKRFGKLAFSLLDRLPCREIEAVTTVMVSAFIAHWSEPYEYLYERLDCVLNHNLASGDIHQASAAVLFIRFQAGENLVVLKRRFRTIHSRLHELKQEDTLQWLKPAYQCVLNLQLQDVNSWVSLTDLSGEAMHESEYISAAPSGQTVLLALLWTYKLQLAYHFGHTKIAAKMCDNLALKTRSPIRFHANQVNVTFYAAMTYFQLYRERSRWSDLRQARKYQRALENLKPPFSRPNLVPLLAILQAESVSYKKSKRSSLRSLQASFSGAITANAEAGFVHLEALSHERAAMAFSTRGEVALTEMHFKRAKTLYQDGWSATAKAEWLEERRIEQKQANVRVLSAATESVSTIPRRILL